MKYYKLYSNTNTFNTILSIYAKYGDSESAYNIVYNIMLNSIHCQPDANTWLLLLKACIRTIKGRYYIPSILQYIENNIHSNNTISISKEIWDIKVQYSLLSNNTLYSTLASYIRSELYQPDEHTILLIIDTCRILNRVDIVMKLYYWQATSEMNRRLVHVRVCV